MSNLAKTGEKNVQSAKKSVYLVLFGFIFIFLICFIAYLAFLNMRLNQSMQALESQKEAEFKKRLQQERARINKDFAEKYAADMVSYEALAKRSQIERKRLRELEVTLNKTKTENR